VVLCRFIFFTALTFLVPVAAVAQEIAVSDATQECLDCHAVFHPGIVAGWKASRHAAMTPAKALKANDLALKVSSKDIAQGLRDVAVGCAECHTLRSKAHADTFEHNGYDIHVVVSPQDCRTCHATEAEQYSRNVMAHAYANLAENKVYNQLENAILADRTLTKGELKMTPADADTRAEACYQCHGTVLKVSGTEVRDTDAGELEFPVIDGWPNQGVGRINLDGSKGACSACHTRHTFSIEVARKPHTCKACHVGPDVPAYKVYSASKHGNIYDSKKQAWDFKAVPWTVGQDFTAPTCATCHVSLLVNTDGEVVNERTHEMKNRLSWRIFGLIYAHPQPKSPDTTIIRNKDGRPLPTDFKGGFADKFLLTPEQQAVHTKNMQATCLACHDTAWVRGHWRRYHNTIQRTNATTLTLTNLMGAAWQKGYAQGLDQGKNPFDESVERQWSDAWLFYANTIRFASAMSGGGDYSVFADGRYQLSRSIIDMHDWLDQRNAMEKLKAAKP
jgi:hydroxylamine dehydrogenase